MSEHAVVKEAAGVFDMWKRGGAAEMARIKETLDMTLFRPVSNPTADFLAAQV